MVRLSWREAVPIGILAFLFLCSMPILLDLMSFATDLLVGALLCLLLRLG